MADTIFLAIIAVGVLAMLALKTADWLEDPEPVINTTINNQPEPPRVLTGKDGGVEFEGFTPCDICGGQHHDDDHSEPWDEGEENGPTIMLIRDDDGTIVPFTGYDDDDDDVIDFEAKLAALRGDPVGDDDDNDGLWVARGNND